MEIISSSLQETKDLAQKIAYQLKSGDVLALYGDLGSAKTTFTRFLVEALGFEDRVQSPTFIVRRKYHKKPDLNENTNMANMINAINHLDLYRLRTNEEVFDIGIKEIVEEENTLTIIEWPELAEEFLPKNTIKLCFYTLSQDSRKILVQVGF